MLTQSIETLAMRAQESQLSEKDELSRLHYEASRLNGSLMQLLAIYRADHDAFSLTIKEVFITDLLSDAVGNNQWWADQKKIQLHLDADPELEWFCDEELIGFLINDVILNAIRYCENQVNISARIADNQLEVKVLNDGEGFPDEIINLATQDSPNPMAITQNRSGLGLYFANLIAKAHCYEGIYGSIELSNQTENQGSQFLLRLP